jgi:hypothetical protein
MTFAMMGQIMTTSAAEAENILHYNFEQGSVDDQTGVVGDGTKLGTPITDTPGHLGLGDALYFDDYNDAVRTPTYTSGGADLSVALWLKMDTTTFIQFEYILMKSNNIRLRGNYLTSDIQFDIWRWLDQYNIEMGWSLGITCSIPTLNTWNHIILTYDHGPGIIKIFLNGIECNSRTHTSTSMHAYNSYLVFGDDDQHIDEFKVFDVAVNDDQAQNLFNDLPLTPVPWDHLGFDNYFSGATSMVENGDTIDVEFTDPGSGDDWYTAYIDKPIDLSLTADIDLQYSYQVPSGAWGQNTISLYNDADISASFGHYDTDGTDLQLFSAKFYNPSGGEIINTNDPHNTHSGVTNGDIHIEFRDVTATTCTVKIVMDTPNAPTLDKTVNGVRKPNKIRLSASYYDTHYDSSQSSSFQNYEETLIGFSAVSVTPSVSEAFVGDPITVEVQMGGLPRFTEIMIVDRYTSSFDGEVWGFSTIFQGPVAGGSLVQIDDITPSISTANYFEYRIHTPSLGSYYQSNTFPFRVISPVVQIYSLIAHYKLETTTQVFDETRRNTRLQSDIHNVNQVIGYDGDQAYQFTGDIGSYVSLGNPSKYRTPTGSVSAWVNIPSGGGGVVLSSGNTVTSYSWIMLRVFEFQTDFYAYGNGHGSTACRAPGIAKDVWTHIVWQTTSGTTNGWKIFINGVDQGPLDCYYPTSAINYGDWFDGYAVGNGADSFSIGMLDRKSGNDYGPYKGSIDELRIYNYVLDRDEIKSLNGQFQTNIGNVSITKGSGFELPITITNTGTLGAYSISVSISSNDYSDYSDVVFYEDYQTLEPGGIYIHWVEIDSWNFTANGKEYALNTGTYDISIDVFNTFDHKLDFRSDAVTVTNPDNVIFVATLEDSNYRSNMDPYIGTTEQFLEDAVSRELWCDPGFWVEDLCEFEGGYNVYDEDGYEDMLQVDFLFRVFEGWDPSVELDQITNPTEHNLTYFAKLFAQTQLGLPDIWNHTVEGTAVNNHGYDILLSLTRDIYSYFGAGGFVWGMDNMAFCAYEGDNSVNISQAIIVHELSHLFGALEGDVSGIDQDAVFTIVGFIMYNQQWHNLYKFYGIFVFHAVSYQAIIVNNDRYK